MALTTDAIERCLEGLARMIREDDALSAAFTASIDTYFRGPAPAGGVLETLLGARRHLEWFLVEAQLADVAGATIDRLAEPFAQHLTAQEANEELDAAEVAEAKEAFDALLKSHTGIFEVEEVREEGAWIRDVTGFGSYALGGTPELQRALSGGALVVGRLYPAGDGLHLASPAAAVVRGGNVVAALRRDIEAIRAKASGKVLRVSQGELETMFFGTSQITSHPAGQPSDTSGGAPVEARNPQQILLDAGLGAARAKAILARLEREPRDPNQLLHGGDDVLGRILDELAFETSVDLEPTRAALLLAWDVQSKANHPATPAAYTNGAAVETPDSVEPPEPDDEAVRRKAIDQFQAGRERGGDPLELLGRLQQELGISDDSDTEVDAPAPDFPGVVGAMIEEMKWELGATRDGFDTRTLDPLQHLATFGKRIGVFEELRGHDLFQFATFWLQETRALASDDEARRLVAALREFCEWALDAHEVDLGSEFLDALDGLEESLPRMRVANDSLEAAPGSDVGQLYEVVAIGDPSPDSFETSGDRLRAASGDVLTVMLDDAIRPHLRDGDRVRAEVALLGDARIFCCYPPESKALAR